MSTTKKEVFKTNVYILDIKAYEPAVMSEIPWRLPEDCWDGVGRLRVDYHTCAMVFTEEELEEFCAWCNDHGSILKVIGTERAVTAPIIKNEFWDKFLNN